MNILPVGWGVFFISSLIGLWAGAPLLGQDSLGSDVELNLVVGEQQVLSGFFDSQISLSRKGLVNVRWLSDDRVLLTALKSGVLLIDPTPLSQSRKRWLVQIKTQHQARKQSSSSLSLKPKEASSLSPTLKDYPWFRNIVRQETEHSLIIDCFHERKVEVFRFAAEFWPQKSVQCAVEAYELQVMVLKEEGKRRSEKPWVDVVNRKLSQQDLKQHHATYHQWHVMVHPSQGPIDYKLEHKGLSTALKNFSLHHNPSDDPWRLSFDYHVSVGDVESSGHVHRTYRPESPLFLAQLSGQRQGGERREWQELKSVPILGYLLRSSFFEEEHKQLSFWLFLVSSSMSQR